MPSFVNQLVKPQDGPLGWNTYAIADAPLATGTMFTFVISQDEVGVAVGVQPVLGAENGPGYMNMLLSIVATTKKYSVYVGSTLAFGPVAYDPTKKFAIAYVSGRLVAIYDGIARHSIAHSGDIIPACAIYSPFDSTNSAAGGLLVDTSSRAGTNTSSTGFIPSGQGFTFVNPHTVGITALADMGVHILKSGANYYTYRAGGTAIAQTGRVFLKREYYSAGEAFGSTSVAVDQYANALGSTSSTGVIPTFDTEGGDQSSNGGGGGFLVMTSGGYAGMPSLTYALSYEELTSGLTGSGTGMVSGDTVPWGYDGGSDPTNPNGYSMVGDAGLFLGWQSGLLAKLNPPAAMAWEVGPDSYAYSIIPKLTSFGADSLPSSLTLDASFFGFSLYARISRDGFNTVTGDVPPLTLVARTGAVVNGSAPAITADIEATVSTMLSVDAVVPPLTLSANVLVGQLVTVEAEVPPLALSTRTGAVVTGGVPSLSLSADLAVGSVMRVDAQMPELRLVSSITVENKMTVTGQVPELRALYGIIKGNVPELRLVARFNAEESVVTALYAVNMKNGGITEYTNFAFDFFGMLGSQYVGANGSGLYLLDGADDDGSPIAAKLEIPPRDFGTTKLKTLPYVYMEASSAAGLKVTSTADETTSVAAMTQTIGRNRRAKLARGVKGVQWAVTVENTNGEKFAIDSIDLVPMLLRRKV